MSPKLIRVRPVSRDILVPRPAREGRGFLPLEGAVVEFDTYWRRRIEDGDAVEIPLEEPTRAAAQEQEE